MLDEQSAAHCPSRDRQWHWWQTHGSHDTGRSADAAGVVTIAEAVVGHVVLVRPGLGDAACDPNALASANERQRKPPQSAPWKRSERQSKEGGLAVRSSSCLPTKTAAFAAMALDGTTNMTAPVQSAWLCTVLRCEADANCVPVWPALAAAAAACRQRLPPSTAAVAHRPSRISRTASRRL